MRRHEGAGGSGDGDGFGFFGDVVRVGIVEVFRTREAAPVPAVQDEHRAAWDRPRDGARAGALPAEHEFPGLEIRGISGVRSSNRSTRGRAHPPIAGVEGVGLGEDGYGSVEGVLSAGAGQTFPDERVGQQRERLRHCAGNSADRGQQEEREGNAHGCGGCVWS